MFQQQYDAKRSQYESARMQCRIGCGPAAVRSGALVVGVGTFAVQNWTRACVSTKLSVCSTGSDACSAEPFVVQQAVLRGAFAVRVAVENQTQVCGSMNWSVCCMSCDACGIESDVGLRWYEMECL